MTAYHTSTEYIGRSHRQLTRMDGHVEYVRDVPLPRRPMRKLIEAAALVG